jgi:hypothetical protein
LPEIVTQYSYTSGNKNNKLWAHKKISYVFIGKIMSLKRVYN